MNKIQSIMVKDLKGKFVNLSELYANKDLLIIIYNNACLGCTGRAIPLAHELNLAHPSLALVGIHSNFGPNAVDEEAIKSIFTSKEVPFPIYIDENHVVYDQFQSEGTPQWLLINSSGQLVRSIFGSQEGAQNRLALALEELGL